MDLYGYEFDGTVTGLDYNKAFNQFKELKKIILLYLKLH